MLNRIRHGYYRTIECLGYDLVVLGNFLEEGDDKRKLNELFEFLAEE